MPDWRFVAEAVAIAPGHYETVDLDGAIAAVFNVAGSSTQSRMSALTTGPC